jgi:hypothetical protein
MVNLNKLTIVLLPVVLLLSAWSCRKQDRIDTDPSLRLLFSTDTVLFDTVFTSLGSVTKRLIVHNGNDHKVSIAQIRLAGGTASPYRINIDGDPGIVATDVAIPGHDSIFIFVRVTIDPSNENLPFVVSDSILFTLNGNIQDVELVAWGQNAHFLNQVTLQGSSVWDSIRPFVVYGHVRVDTASLLMIMPGSKIYFHKSSNLLVSRDATIKVYGNLQHPVRFQGDRLDPFYRDLPGQWGGIVLESGSKENEINYAVIKNGSFGLVVDSIGSSPEPTLRLDNTIIRNMTSDAVYAISTSIISTNCVLVNCGGAALWVEHGGSYDFRQLTIGNYWGSSVRLSPSLYLSNYSTDTFGQKTPGPLTKAFFGNCIIYGTEPDELLLDTLENIPFSSQFDHCLLRTTLTLDAPQAFIDCLKNEDPLFRDPGVFDFSPDSLSPVIGYGIPMGVPFDLNGIDRGNTPDLGAYQWVPTQ